MEGSGGGGAGRRGGEGSREDEESQIISEKALCFEPRHSGGSGCAVKVG